MSSYGDQPTAETCERVQVSLGNISPRPHGGMGVVAGCPDVVYIGIKCLSEWFAEGVEECFYCL